jgi:hypothetical protein
MWVKTAVWVDIKSQVAVLQAQMDALKGLVNEGKVHIGRLEDQIAAERKRSDTTVDRLLNTKGVQGITPSEKVDLEELTSMFEETPEEIAAVRKAILDHGIEEVLFEGQ